MSHVRGEQRQVYRVADLKRPERHQALLVVPLGKRPQVQGDAGCASFYQCPCGYRYESYLQVELLGETTEYADRCLTTEKPFIDNRKVTQ